MVSGEGVLLGYAGKLLRIDLTQGKASAEALAPALLRRYLGGTALGVRLLYDEVPPAVAWGDPENRLIMASGPLGGTRVMGSGTICVVTRGALTGGVAATQANGYFGAYLRHTGHDALIVQGRAEKLSYVLITEDGAEIRDASHLAGLDTWQTEVALREEVGTSPLSIFCIGPAGERRVRFAALVGDSGHVAAHNGPGAVLGAKNLKALVVARGKRAVPVADREALVAASGRMFEAVKADPGWSQNYHHGTLWLLRRSLPLGRVAFQNYTTNVSPMTEAQLETFTPEYLRTAFQEAKPHPCWACRMHHCHLIKIPEGPLAGEPGEEPEYEGLAAMGTQLGIYDGLTATALSNEVDRLGMDVNETGWLLGLVIECYEAGILSRDDTDGLEMTWGNVAAVRAMLRKIAFREGVGDRLAAGVMRAAPGLGGDAAARAVHTMTGNTPMSHDHRRFWPYLCDISLTEGGSSDLHIAPQPGRFGIADLSTNPQDANEVADFLVRVRGISPLIDSLGVCHQTNREVIDLLVAMLRAATGWEFTADEMLNVGLRAVNLMRVFNLRSGFSPEHYAPSPRYGSAPPDGAAAGQALHPVFKEMRRRYYEGMGWHPETGWPLPETLARLGLEDLIPDLEG